MIHVQIACANLYPPMATSNPSACVKVILTLHHKWPARKIQQFLKRWTDYTIPGDYHRDSHKKDSCIDEKNIPHKRVTSFLWFWAYMSFVKVILTTPSLCPATFGQEPLATSARLLSQVIQDIIRLTSGYKTYPSMGSKHIPEIPVL